VIPVLPWAVGIIAVGALVSGGGNTLPFTLTAVFTPAEVAQGETVTLTITVDNKMTEDMAWPPTVTLPPDLILTPQPSGPAPKGVVTTYTMTGTAPAPGTYSVPVTINGRTVTATLVVTAPPPTMGSDP